MRSWIRIGALAVVFFVSRSALAQTTTESVPPPEVGDQASAEAFEPELAWLLAWNMSIGTFDTFDFASNYSFRGVSFEARYAFAPRLSAGLLAAWHVLDEKEADVTASRDGVTVTGTQIRTANFVPILARFVYTMQDALGDGVDVWGGLGVGTYYIERRLEVGLFSRDQDAWHFGLAPEVGASVSVGRKTNVFFSTAWNFAFESGQIPTQSYLNFNVGFMFL